MAFQDCPHHSDLSPRWGYWLYQDFHGSLQNLSTWPRREGPHRIIRGGPWHLEVRETPTTTRAPFRIDGASKVVRGGPALASSDAEARIWVPGGKADGVLEVDIRGGGCYPSAGLCFRHKTDGAANCLVAYIDKGTKVSAVKLTAYADPADGFSGSNIASTNVTLAANTWYHLEVRFFGPIIQVWLDGVKRIDTVLATLQTEKGVGLFQGSVYPPFEQQWRYFRFRKRL